MLNDCQEVGKRHEHDEDGICIFCGHDSGEEGVNEYLRRFYGMAYKEDTRPSDGR